MGRIRRQELAMKWQILNSGLRLAKQSVVFNNQIYRVETREFSHQSTPINDMFVSPAIFGTYVTNERGDVVDKKEYTDVDDAETGHCKLVMIYSYQMDKPKAG